MSFLPEITLDPKHRLSYASWYQQVKQPSSVRKKKLGRILVEGREELEEQRNGKEPNEVHESQEDQKIAESVEKT